MKTTLLSTATAGVLCSGLLLVPGTGSAAPAPAASVPIPKPSASDVRAAVAALPGVIKRMQKKTGVPGVAAAVVYRDELIYKAGFGVRDVNKKAKVTPSTVFQMASVSKPVGASAVAGAVGDKVLRWDDPVAKYLPGFTLRDPWVGSRVTVGDLYSHRSGLPGLVGNDLEAFGYDRGTIIDRLRFAPLSPFRITYSYSNFGLTTAGEAAARAAGTTWDRLTRQQVFKPLGMSKSSYSFANFSKQKNRAALHQVVDGKWVQAQVRNAEPQAPAGSLNSNVLDMAKWLRMELKQGKFEGRQVIKRAPLQKALTSQIRSSAPNDPTSPARTYAYGMDVEPDTTGRMRWAHSGAFSSGAATRIMMIPELKVGIVVLTNGVPVGLPEAIAQSFGDLVEYGSVQTDWLKEVQPAFAPLTTPTFEVNGTKKPKNPAPAGPLSQYAGDYANDYLGAATVTQESGKLILRLGPDGVTRLKLKHWDGDVFYYDDIDMPPGFYAGVTFGTAKDGVSRTMSIDETPAGLGTMSRVLR